MDHMKICKHCGKEIAITFINKMGEKLEGKAGDPTGYTHVENQRTWCNNTHRIGFQAWPKEG